MYEGTSSQAGMESRCRRSVGGHGEEGKEALGSFGLGLADFLSRALQGRALYVSYLSPSPSLSLCQLPSNKMVSYEGGWRWKRITERETERCG